MSLMKGICRIDKEILSKKKKTRLNQKEENPKNICIIRM